MVYSEAGKGCGGVAVGVLATSLLCCGNDSLLDVNLPVVTYHGVDLNSSERGGEHPEEGLSLETEYRMAMHRKLSLR